MLDAKTSLGADYHVWIELPVLWGDMDALGHVNNTVYFRWFESARVEYLDRIAWEEGAPGEHLGPILASVKCDFRRQVTFPDTVTIGARVTRLGRTSMTMTHAIASAATGAIVAEGDSTVVLFDYAAGKSCPLPAKLREAIARLEARSFDG